MAEKPERFFMRVDEDFLRRVDEWRRKQADIPNRSEAIRRLVALSTGPDEEPVESRCNFAS